MLELSDTSSVGGEGKFLITPLQQLGMKKDECNIPLSGGVWDRVLTAKGFLIIRTSFNYLNKCNLQQSIITSIFGAGWLRARRAFLSVPLLAIMILYDIIR